MQDFSLYDRCITRGAIGSWMPAVYGNGARIIQTPDSVVISYEMVHDTRIIPLDNRPHLGPGIQLWMGNSRAHFEGNTLVIESRNFTDRTAVGGAPHSANLKLTERLTRVDPEMIDYEIRVEDPDTFAKPFTIRMTVTAPAGLRDLRVRLPRRQQRDAECAERRTRLREGRGRSRRQRACRRPSACSSA